MHDLSRVLEVGGGSGGERGGEGGSLHEQNGRLCTPATMLIWYVDGFRRKCRASTEWRCLLVGAGVSRSTDRRAPSFHVPLGVMHEQQRSAPRAKTPSHPTCC